MGFYQTAIPQPDDFLSISQADMQTNFEEINNYVTQNHVAFTSPDLGKHKFTTLTKQATMPVTIADEVALVCADDFAVNPKPQLFFRGPNKAALDPSKRMTAFPGIAARFIMELDSKGNPTIRNSYNIKKFEFLRTGPIAKDNPIQFAFQYYVEFEKILSSSFYIPQIISQTENTSSPRKSIFSVISQPSEKGFIIDYPFQIPSGNVVAPTLQKTTVIIFGEIASE